METGTIGITTRRVTLDDPVAALDWAKAVEGGPPQLSVRWLVCHGAGFDRPCEYAVAYAEGRPVAVAVFHLRFDTDDHTKYRLSNHIDAAGPGLPFEGAEDLLGEPSVVVVAPSSYVSGLHVAADAGRRTARAAAGALLRLVGRVAAESGAGSVFLPHLPDPAPGWLAEEISGPSHLFPMGASAYLDLGGMSTFGEYLSGFTAKRRREVVRERRAFAAAGLRIETSPVVTVSSDVVRRQVGHYRRYGLVSSEERISGQFHSLQKEYEGRLLFLKVIRGDSGVIGHVLAIQEADWLVPKLAGFEGREGFAYFEATYYAMIEWALRGPRCARIDYGGAAIDAKVRRGCRVRPLQGALLLPR
ncbi:peptidogalycan biosysnthesis protein [Streptosporangium sp. NPDC051022]|uniref:peptidogalycan biosysnthesis protein n=1 Tax=Streptosporangium sp. NPDC051022 TaxID=3155752 RepID=UPI0034412C49